MKKYTYKKLIIIVALVLFVTPKSLWAQVYGSAVASGMAGGSGLTSARGSSTLGAFRSYSAGLPGGAAANRSHLLTSNQRFSGQAPRASYNRAMLANNRAAINNQLQSTRNNSILSNRQFAENPSYAMAAALQQNAGQAPGPGSRFAATSVIKPLRSIGAPRRNQFAIAIMDLPVRYKSKVPENIQTAHNLRRQIISPPATKTKTHKYSQ